MDHKVRHNPTQGIASGGPAGLGSCGPKLLSKGKVVIRIVGVGRLPRCWASCLRAASSAGASDSVVVTSGCADPRSSGTQHNGTEHGGVKVAHHFLQRE